MRRRLGGTKGAQKEPGIKIFLWKRKGKQSTGKRNFVPHSIVSVVRRVEFVSDRVSYITLRGRWCNILVLNVHGQSEENSDDSKENFIRN